MSSGWAINVRTMAIRRHWPPANSCGWRFLVGRPQPDRLQHPAGRRPPLAGGAEALQPAVMCGFSEQGVLKDDLHGAAIFAVAAGLPKILGIINDADPALRLRMNWLKSGLN
jgi:hypothetical protein